MFRSNFKGMSLPGAPESSSKKGFTVIELLVVVTVIAILATIILFGLRSAQASARDTQRVETLIGIQSALESYFNDFGHYPKGAWGNPAPDVPDRLKNGAVVCCGDSFNLIMAVLHDGGYLNAFEFKDPLTQGPIFTGATGTGNVISLTTVAPWNVSAGRLITTPCGNSRPMIYDNSDVNSVSYYYNTPIGGGTTNASTSYTLCLVKESGGIVSLKSPE